MQKIRQVLDQNSWLRNASHIFLFLFFVLSRGQHKKKFFLSRGQTKKKKNSSALRGLVRTGGWKGRGWIATCCSRRGNLRKRRGARSEALTGARRRARRTHTRVLSIGARSAALGWRRSREARQKTNSILSIWLIRHWRIPTSVGQNSRPVLDQPPACKESKLQHALIQLLLEENKKKITNYSQ